ncbi:hypothetical protein QYE76_012358 [Lolium multiflorum]|uniref:DUF8039 domain-containing protein n=1 Tax=Lolium multiflorum TaxID=4521 RepID=A0AAD8TX20_LOLMU|nr:hypothetical protein QYE76_012358 [Lolium multiflorum]
MTMVDFNNLGYLDEPFVLAKDVAQVFYVKDMSSKPRKRKDKKTIGTSCDDPKRHIVLSGKRNIVGVEDKTDMSEDYNMFAEIPPFKVNTDPSIKLNDEDAPWIRHNRSHFSFAARCLFVDLASAARFVDSPRRRCRRLVTAASCALVARTSNPCLLPAPPRASLVSICGAPPRAEPLRAGRRRRQTLRAPRRIRACRAAAVERGDPPPHTRVPRRRRGEIEEIGVAPAKKKQRGFHGGLTGWCTADRNYCTGASGGRVTAPEPPRYPVDDIKEMKACPLYYPIGNMSMKVATGSALPPGALHHNNPIPDGYARLTVEEIVQGFEDLDIDIATPEGATRLGDVKRVHFYGRSLSSFQARRQGKQVHPLRWWWRRRRWWWWLTYTSGGSADAAPHLRRVRRRPILVRRVIGRRPQSTRRSRSSPGLLTRTLTAEEVEAGAAADLEKWKARCKKKIEGEPKPVFSDEQKKWAKSFLNTSSQAAKNLPTTMNVNFVRKHSRSGGSRGGGEAEKKALEEAQKLERGKQQVTQLGEQSKQSIPPLIVKAAGPEDEAPDVIAAAAAQGLTVAKAKEQAADLGLTLRVALGLDDVAMKDVVFGYVKDGLSSSLRRKRIYLDK